MGATCPPACVGTVDQRPTRDHPPLDPCNGTRYTRGVIQSFHDSRTEKVWRREVVKKFDPDLQQRAYRKLLALHAADRVSDLRIPPGNRLEALKGDRAGQHSIRINQQWRICFTWTAHGPADVEIVDYH